MSLIHTGNVVPEITAEEHNGLLNAKKTVDVRMAIRTNVDSGDANVTYVGKALVGTASSAAAWQIQKIDETTGAVVTWADGNSAQDNVYDNRESLSYS